MSTMPTTNVLEIFFVLITISSGIAQFPQSETKFIWRETEEWSSCSQTCGVGIQKKKIMCIEKLDYSESIVANEYCIKPPPSVNRPCNMGDCNSNYVWRPGKWSDCSQTCGNSGRKSRDVECVYDEGSGNLMISNVKFCNASLKPETSSSCNVLDCPFVIVPGEWGKCMQGVHKCVPGIQRRNLTCVALLKDGRLKNLDRFACLGKSKPPISWRKCEDYLKKKECLQNLSSHPIIESKFNTLVQMRKTKSLNIGVGQLAYVLLYTKIIMNCPVNYFVPREIEWKHGSTLYKYNGKSKDRIRVDRNGRLRVKKLEVTDQGTWTCIAGSSNSSIIVKVRNPSVGFQDWVLRRALWNQEMMNEDPGNGMRRQDVVQWIKNGWSKCSVTCGGKGIQSRDVHCEQLDTRHYNILKDEVCEERGQIKPLTTRSCQMSTQCPKWVLLEVDPNKCTNKCLRIGFAEIQVKLQCIHQEKEMDFSACNKKEMPDIECQNEKCQVGWKASNWSKCSRSCGGFGIMARYLICVWKHTEEPAGSLCYNEKLPLPEVVKSCKAPKCNLKCVDLSPSCMSKSKYCKLSMYRHICCKTCSRADILNGMQKDGPKNMKNQSNGNKTKSVKKSRTNSRQKKYSNVKKYNEYKDMIERNNPKEIRAT